MAAGVAADDVAGAEDVAVEGVGLAARSDVVSGSAGAMASALSAEAGNALASMGWVGWVQATSACAWAVTGTVSCCSALAAGRSGWVVEADVRRAPMTPAVVGVSWTLISIDVRPLAHTAGRKAPLTSCAGVNDHVWSPCRSSIATEAASCRSTRPWSIRRTTSAPFLRPSTLTRTDDAAAGWSVVGVFCAAWVAASTSC